ncbi:hypothetical protein PFICI_14942 [Pestalotiopsis fici W106-1]|uniref:Phytocyanin domain-containing protein n=1 Tax=Pestalotiopsis fici (strain W106-1 / CGMCC3.15140) TaxID=1229662 RepID=W3WJM9_PESFW|nr:uncharacterized protein PFICI_14942 [Pestalotiopsis fici W106-1]ETS73337.1 hypothetical protein PFICI_14942 [Pestalotiopsis fici W106-1]
MRTLSVLVTAGAAMAATIRIDALNLAFVPNVTTASVGDVLEFHFLPNNHSVAMGDFEDPCQPAKSGGFFSGYYALNSGEADNVFRVTVNDTDPIWLYCTKLGHCKNGMVGVVNPTTERTLEGYLAGARAFNGTLTEAGAAFGGITVPNTDTSSASSTAASMTAPMSSSTSTSSVGTAEFTWKTFLFSMFLALAISSI